MKVFLTILLPADLLLVVLSAYLLIKLETGLENVLTKREAIFLKGIINMADLYKINKKISQGAFGTVYEGVNVKTGEIVAIK